MGNKEFIEIAKEAELAFKVRGCGNDYRIVVLKTIEVKRIIERGK
jgi:hypothetical protein